MTRTLKDIVANVTIHLGELQDFKNIPIINYLTGTYPLKKEKYNNCLILIDYNGIDDLLFEIQAEVIDDIDNLKFVTGNISKEGIFPYAYVCENYKELGIYKNQILKYTSKKKPFLSGKELLKIKKYSTNVDNLLKDYDLI